MKTIVFATLVFGAVASANAQWTVVSLHPAGVVFPSEAYGVGVGQQVGYARVGSRHASLWSGSASSWVDLNPPVATISEALGVSGGQQVGYAEVFAVVRASLWNGSAASWVDLHPTGATESVAYAVSGGQQVGYAGRRASLWSGSATSWVNLHPSPDPGAPFGTVTLSRAYGIGDGQQVGLVVIGGTERASLWTGSAASWVGLDPASASRSIAYGVSDGQQVGVATIGGMDRASLWTGTAASWVDLSPAGTFNSEALGVSGGMQVGYARLGGATPHASLWEGTAASWVDLHAFLPAHYTESYARAIVRNETGTYVAGSAYNALMARHEAMLWVLQPVDSDNDGLTNEDEAIHGTNPNDPDTDDDGLLDGTEVDMSQGTGCPSPLISDSDYDGLFDGAEVALGTSPCNPDTDGDGVNDSQDPTPLVPGVPGSYVENALRELSDSVLNLSLSLLEGPNNNAKAGRRNAMSNMLISAANKVAIGDSFGAIDELTSLLQKLDGNASPPDWMANGTAKDELYNEIQLMIALLDI